MAHDLGTTANLNLLVAPFDVTTAATVQVTSPAGTVSNPTPTTEDDGNHWVAQLVVDEPGVWTVKWTVAGTGVGVRFASIDVDPVPPLTDEQRRVRLLIADTDSSNQFFSTLQLNDFLAMNGDSVRRAAAQALDVWAANEAMVSKKIRTQDLSTDGPAVADALRKAAAELRRQEDQGEGDAELSGFEIVEFEPYRCRPELSGY